MKKIFGIIAFVAISLIAVPQTQAQQQELEQIARRSINGVSAQDRQRVIQIMTDVYMAQGMSRTQAASLAAMAADSMFSDYQEDAQSAEARRLVEASEQQQRQAEITRQADLADMAERERQRQQPGSNTGWPTAQLRERGLPNLRQPAGTTASYNGNAEWAERIYLTGANSNSLQDLRQQMATITGQQITVSGNRFEVEYRRSGSGRLTQSSSLIVELQGSQITISFRESGA